MIAAREGHTDVIRMLLNGGAKVDRSGKGGQTPLIKAASEGRIDAVRTLLNNRAKVDRSGKDGGTALMVAAQEGHPDVIKTLLARGAEVDRSGEDNVTALMRAVCKGHIVVVRRLLGSKADINAGLYNSFTPLMAAVFYEEKEVVEELLLHSIQKKELITQRSEATKAQRFYAEHQITMPQEHVGLWGKSALDIAKEHNNIAIIDLLREKINEVNYEENGLGEFDQALKEIEANIGGSESGYCWYSDMTKAAQILTNDLRNYTNNYFTKNNVDAYKHFKGNCKTAIREARPAIERYRDLRRLLNNIALAFVGLFVFYGVAVLVNKARTSNFLFFNETSSLSALNRLDNATENLPVFRMQ